MNEIQFEKHFREWYSPLCRFAFRVVGRKDLAEDLVQEVFEKVWSRRAQLPEDLSVKSYLFQAVYRSALNAVSRNPYVLSEEQPETWDWQTGQSDLEMKDLEVALAHGLEELPDACRQIFLLQREEGLSYKEIAESLDLSIKTVENQMGKALRILRSHLLPYLILFLALIFSEKENYSIFFDPNVGVKTLPCVSNIEAHFKHASIRN
jgi:RNA polymerase sigma-70 factor (ECF subfamily)